MPTSPSIPARLVGQALMSHGAYTETVEDTEWLVADVNRCLEALAAGEPIEDALIDAGWCSDPGWNSDIEGAAEAIREAVGQ